MATRQQPNIGFVYAIAGWALILTLMPIFLFGLEALFTQFDEDLGIASSIAGYYEGILSDESDGGVLTIIYKFIIPVFAFLSVNKAWRKKYRWSHFIVFWLTLIAFLLIFVYEYILSISLVQERLDLFGTSYESILRYFQLHQYPFGILLGSLIGLKLFQTEEGE